MAQMQIVCTACGLERAIWSANDGRGYRVDEEFYCCRGCVEATGCTCGSELSSPPPLDFGKIDFGTAQWGED